MTSISKFKSKTLKEAGLVRRDSPSVTVDTKIVDVINALAKEPHFVVVLDQANKIFKGIFSVSDLDKVNPKNIDSQIKDLMVDKGIVSIGLDQTLEEVAQKFKESKHRILPVLTNGEYEGIVSSADFLEKLRSDVKIT